MQLFNDGWRFYRSEPGVEVSGVWERLALFQPVDLPHDWLIYDVKNLYQDGTGWYYKRFSADVGTGERVILRFDGVYMDSTVYVNRRRVMDWKYGYSTFDADVTEYLADGENEVLVEVRFLSPNSRWYSGAGIYRNVWLHVCPAAYLPLDGTYVTAREMERSGGQSSRWQIEISTEAAGELREGFRCRYSLFYQGKLAWELGEAEVAAGLAQLTACVDNPLLWDVDDPNCYQLCVELLDESGDQADACRVTVGLRTLEFTTDRGLFLNHRHLKLHGVCEHHDLGCLGAAFHTEAMRRKFVTLREMGVNALRTSHNMPAPELMELADEMGFLVLDEAFDMWERSKTQYDYARFFEEWAERDVRSWIRRDRNHPCLLMWSIGNEIYDTHAGERGQEITGRLAGYVRQHDPRGNGKVTIGSNYMPWENAQKCADILKFAGYNYGEKYYAEHHAAHPDWIIYGSETESIVQSRGVYHFPLAQSCLAEVDEQCSSLGNSTTSWGAQDLERMIAEDRDCVYSLGQFLWTGFDYIGEPTPYHTKNSYFGQIDTAGFPKDAFYVFQASWRDAKEYPMVHLFPYWDWNEGQIIDVAACTNGDSVELFVNGQSRGRQEITHAGGSKLMGKWRVAYEPGELLAVAYDGEGREIARQARTSFGESAAVVLEANRKEIRADGEDLCFVTIRMIDRDGRPVENAMDYVTVHVDGPGRLLGLDNGDSTDYEEYKTNCRKLFNGKLLAVIASTPEAGEITVRVEGCGERIRGAMLRFRSVEAPVRAGICCMENCGGENKAHRIPVRKAELSAPTRLFTPECPQARVSVRLLPEDTTDRELVWEAVNDAAIRLGYVKVTAADAVSACVEAWGDGKFRVRCLVKNDEGKVCVLSQLECEAAGFGESLLNPYDYISAGLYAELIGEVTSGNEKGIATARDAESGAVYRKIDFGEYGSDVITIDIFSLSDSPCEVEIWEGRPDAGRLIETVTYQKPSIWNVYQAETWKLPERLSGVKDISLVLHDKIHIRGFSFRRLEKSFQRLEGGECTRVYGDSFTQDGGVIRDIGNNVTVVYDGMDFGDGADHVTIWGSTPLAVNTIHLRFVPESGEERRVIVEYAGAGSEPEGQTFPVEGFRGKGKLELVFLPGSSFTLEALHFSKQ